VARAVRNVHYELAVWGDSAGDCFQDEADLLLASYGRDLDVTDRNAPGSAREEGEGFDRGFVRAEGQDVLEVALKLKEGHRCNRAVTVRPLSA